MPLTKQSDSLQGEETTVHQLFGITDDRFRAPEFQRHYVWRTGVDDAEVDRFWTDFDTLIEEDEDSSLFLGAVVLQVLEAGRPGVGALYSIIDGQQRITTLYLILVAIVEAFQDAGEVEQAKYLSNQYLLVQSPSKAGMPRVEPTVSDRGAMAEILQCLKEPVPRSGWSAQLSSDPRLLDAWRKVRAEVRNRIASEAVSSEIDIEMLKVLRDQILERLELVTITLGSRHNPHEVYERLNTRGRRLTEIDLVRNTVFYTAGGDSRTAQVVYENYWDPFESQLGDKQNDYWFPYALTKVPSTTRAKSYADLHRYWRDNITKGMQGELQAKGIVDSLRECVGGFRAISGISNNAGAEIADDVWDAVLRLRRMDISPVMYPFLMQLVQRHLDGVVSGSDVIRAIGVVDSFLVRRTFLGLANQGIHAVFKNLWPVTEGDLSDLEGELAARLQFPSDDQFAEGVRTFPLYRVKASRCRYVLSEYEGSFVLGDSLYPLGEDMTADHLLPQGADVQEWGGWTESEKKDLGDTWANLVPLGQRAQSQKGAKSWAEQHELMIVRYGATCKSTKDVFQRWPDEWTAMSLRERAEELVDWAVGRWPRTLV